MSKRRRKQKPQPQQNKVETREPVTGIDVIDADSAEDVAAAEDKAAGAAPAKEETAKSSDPDSVKDAVIIETLPEEHKTAEESESLEMDYVTRPEEEKKASAPEEETLDLAYEETGGKKAPKAKPKEEKGKDREEKKASPAPEKQEPVEEKQEENKEEKKGAKPQEEAKKEAASSAAHRQPGKRHVPNKKKKPAADGIELTDTDAEEEKAKREAEEKGWTFPEAKDDEEKDAAPQKASKPQKVKNWWHHLKRGVRIAITVIVCLILFCLGFFHYEYSRLQKDQSAAYTDDYVTQLKKEEDSSAVAKSAEEDMEKNLADVDEAETVKAEGEIFQDSSVYNILLIGTDDRTKKFSTDARGDTCILLSINKNTGKVTLASFERGTGVPVLWGPYEGQWDWLTHTFRYGGAQMMVEEIRDSYLVDVNRYIRINIRTLVKLIDAIGGIDVELTQTEADHLDHPEGTFTEGYAKGIGMEDEEQFDLAAGTNHLNGVTAMVYARTRYIDDDWHRVQRQRKVIMAAAEKLSKLSASKMISTLDAVVPLVQTDLSETEVAELLTLAPTFMGAEIQQITIPADGTYGSMKGMDGRSMYAVDFNANAKILKEMLYGITDEEAEEQVNEEGGTAATDYTNTSRTSGYVSDKSVTAEDAQTAQQEAAEADTAAANSSTASSGSAKATGAGSSTGTASGAYTRQQSATQEVEQSMNVPQTTTTDSAAAAASTADETQQAQGTTDTSQSTGAAAGAAADYTSQQAAYQQQADTLNAAATQSQAAATQAALQAQDSTLTEEQRAEAQAQANQLAVQAQQQAVAAQQAQQQADAAAAQAAAATGAADGTGN